ncbi:MAG: GntR family transcriptional regulator [Clostridiales bacterium]|nr:GntR family transcriptional regulator [Candidatus Coliplasma caballi]
MIEYKPVSLADQVFDRLENDILTGVYPRGEVLTELRLSEELGVSRTPIREALRRLEQEHIVEAHSRGMTVIGIGREDAHFIFEIRSRIEGLAAAACARNATEEQLREMKDMIELQEFYSEKAESDKVKTLDSSFHELIYRGTGSTVIYDTLLPLHKKLLKFRKNSLSNFSRAAVSAKEHRTIYEAIAARDEKAAEQAMLTHVAKAQEHFEKNTLLP